MPAPKDKHANSPGEKTIGRAGSADTNKRVKEPAFSRSTSRAKQRGASRWSISPPTGGGAGGGTSRVGSTPAGRASTSSWPCESSVTPTSPPSCDGRRPALRSSMPWGSTATSPPMRRSRAIAVVAAYRRPTSSSACSIRHARICRAGRTLHRHPSRTTSSRVSPHSPRLPMGRPRSDRSMTEPAECTSCAASSVPPIATDGLTILRSYVGRPTLFRHATGWPPNLRPN
jgi:hypothetical protein